MFCVETFSFLPNQQSDGRDLACQGEACQMWLHPFGDASFVEILQGSSGGGRSRGSAFEDVFQIVIVVEVQPADGQDFLGSLELTADKAVFPADVSPQCQATIGPQLALGTETVGRLYQFDHESGADGIYRVNLYDELGV